MGAGALALEVVGRVVENLLGLVGNLLGLLIEVVRDDDGLNPIASWRSLYSCEESLLKYLAVKALERVYE